MQITCPWCGTCDLDEFRYGGDAKVTRPAFENADAETWHAYVYLRDNPRGLHREFWHHEAGCRKWILAERDTATHDIHRTWLASGRGTS